MKRSREDHQEFGPKKNIKIAHQSKDQLYKVFQILRYNVWDFFLNHKNGSNESKDLRNLVISCKWIRDLIYEQYLVKGRFTIDQIKAMKIDPKMSSLINWLVIHGSIGDQIIDFTPCVQIVTLKNCPEFSVNQFPKSLVELRFDPHLLYEKRLRPGIFPQTLLKLTLPNNFNQEMFPGLLPSKLQELVIGDAFDQILEPNVLPPCLITLHIGNNFSQIIEPEVLPSSLTELTFGDLFDQGLEKDVLPPNLRKLVFGAYFNKSCVLPQSLTVLNFGRDFNKNIVLPPGLTELSFGSCFNQPLVKGSLPDSLIKLNIGPQYDQPIEPNVLPKKLTHFKINSKYQHQLNGILPELKFLSFISKGLHQAKHFVLEPGTIPQSVQVLKIKDPEFQQELENLLPRGLIELTLSTRYTKSLVSESGCFLPLSLRKLIFRENSIITTINTKIIEKMFKIDFGQRKENWNYDFADNHFVWTRCHD